MREKVYLFLVVINVILLSCNKSSKCSIDEVTNENGEKIKIWRYLDKPTYKYVERFDVNGVCVDRASYINDTLDGKRYLIDEIAQTKEESHYEMGVLNGIVRTEYLGKKMSTEALFLHGKLRVLMHSIKILDDTKYNNLVAYGFDITKVESNGKLSENLGQIYLKSNNYVSVFDLHENEIDWSKSTWYIDDLPDTVPLNQNIDFKVKFEANFTNSKDLRYLKSEFSICESKYFFNDDTTDIYEFKSNSDEHTINCQIRITDPKTRLLTGLIYPYFYDTVNNDTIIANIFYYKQIVVKM